MAFTPLSIAIMLGLVVGFAGFGAFFAHEQWRDLVTVRQIGANTRLMARTSTLLDCLQRERGRSALWTITGSGSEELGPLRQETQDALPAFVQSVQEAVIPEPVKNEVLQALQELPRVRKQVRPGETEEVFREFSRLTGLLLGAQSSVLEGPLLASIGRRFANVFLLESAKESAGRFRGTGAPLLARDAPLSDLELMRLMGAHSGIDANLDSPLLVLDADDAAHFLKIRRQHPCWSRVEEFSQAIFRRSTSGLFGIDPNGFFATLSELMSDIRSTLDHELEAVRRELDAISGRALHRIGETLVALVLFFLLLTLLGNHYLRAWRSQEEAEERTRKTQQVLADLREQDIQIGFQIQNLLLTGAPPKDVQGIQIAARTIPSRGIDGDFYEFFSYDRSRFDLLHGDVMGKGLPAGLAGAALKSQFLRSLARFLSRRQSDQPPPPDSLVARLHAEMTPRLAKLEMFICLHLARFDLVKGKLSLVNCGHTEVLLHHPTTGESELIAGSNMPLGINERETYRLVEVGLVPDDLVVFYSDGVTDPKNAEGQRFGLPGLLGTVKELAPRGVEAILAGVFSRLEAWSGSASYADDVTCVVVRVGKPVPLLPVRVRKVPS